MNFKALSTAALLTCALVGVSTAQAQQSQAQPTPVPTFAIIFKDGSALKSVSTTGVSRIGDSINATVPVGTAMAQQGFPVGSIARIQFPEPAQIQSVTKLLLAGNNPNALVQIEQIMPYYSAFKEIPGSWWAPAMRLKLRAYLNLHRDAAADELIDQLVKAGANDPQAARMASVLQAASLTRKGENDKALAIYDDVLKNATDEETIAAAYANKANTLFAMQQFDPALMAYLRIPVFYPDQQLLMPGVMLGSGKCYLRLASLTEGQNTHLSEAQNTFNDLINQYPSSPEAEAAKTELKKLLKTHPELAPTPTPAPDAAANTQAAPPANTNPAPAAGATPAPQAAATTPTPQATPTPTPAP